jgi:hypothetical protein
MKESTFRFCVCSQPEDGSVLAETCSLFYILFIIFYLKCFRNENALLVVIQRHNGYEVPYVCRDSCLKEDAFRVLLFIYLFMVHLTT